MYDDLYEYRHPRALPHGRRHTYGLRAEHMYVKKDDMSSEAARAHCTSGSPKRTYKHVASLKHVDRFSLKQLNSPASAECRMQVCRTSGCGVPTCG
jgi:hypothetical protein